MNFEKYKLYCIPYSGGNFNSYAKLKEFIPQHIEIVTLELPGRGKRFGEPLLYNIEEMILDIFEQIRNNLHEPYAIYGHSLGALLGIMLCRYIHEMNYNMPKRLFVSGLTAPALIKLDDAHLQPDNIFIEKLREMGGTPDEILNDDRFMEYFLQVIRADFKSIINYNYPTGCSPLDIPITVMLGREEKISDDDAARWQQETLQKISIHRYSGGHFFIFNNMKDICDLITDELTFSK